FYKRGGDSMRHQKLFAFFVCAAAAIALTYGQAVNATLLGTVTDSTGGTVASAKVTIMEANTGISRSTQTNESGNYTFPDLAPGTYLVAVELTGFKKERRTGVVIEVNSTARTDFQLQPGSVSESIDVISEVASLQTDRADTGAKIESIQTAN